MFPGVLTDSGFWMLVERERATAYAMVEDRSHCRKAWNCAGLAVEFALKAVIMKRERFNAWPSKDARRDLHTHDLRTLMKAAGISTRDVPTNLRGSFKAVLDWHREGDYVTTRMPRAVAKDMVFASFGEGQVIEWLKSL